MVVGVTLFITAVLIIAIWVVIEVKRLKHKLFAVLLIGLILFSYLSAAMIFRGQDVDLTSPSGVIEAGGVYFSWLGSVSKNFIQLTGNAINMDWGTDEDVRESVEKGTKKASIFLE
ncbi:hypothetical protein KAR91_54110 [Candidatus Pacearchaeota archaeon]|nr:hypothetical protein [Candidatus Pacearchaeota archaeon]